MPTETAAPTTTLRAHWDAIWSLRGRLTHLWAAVFWAFTLRMFYLVTAAPYHIDPREDYWRFGMETGRIARALATGKGFASPFILESGPTAWLAPLYPALTAGVFKLFGVYTDSSAFVMLSINCVFAALTAWPLYLIARKCLSERAARWAAWMWACFPQLMRWPIRWIWETSLSTLLLTWLLWLTLSLEERATWRRWAGYGLVWGVLALTNTACLSLLPVAALWLAWRRYRAGLPWLAGGALAALIFAAVVTPWSVRNHLVFGSGMPIRGNFGAEIYYGLGDEAEGLWQYRRHPTQNEAEFQRYVRLGERAYVRELTQESIEWIRRNPGRYLQLAGIKSYFFWAGTPTKFNYPWQQYPRYAAYVLGSALAFVGLFLCWRDRRPGRALLAAVMLIFPIPYYLAFAHPRYRHPIEPVMIMLMMYAITEVREVKERPDRSGMPHA